MRILTREDVARSLPYDGLIEALEKAFLSGAVAPERAHHTVEVPNAADATLLVMPAWQPGAALGVKIATIFPGNAGRGLASVNASYLLLDAMTGEPLALLDGAELTLRRTAAASALASRYLSRSDAKRMLMIGTGKLAPHLVDAHCSVREFTEVRIWGRRPDTAARLASTLSTPSRKVAVADNLEDAVRRADVICCATLATEPLVRGTWLVAGQHLDLVGAFRPDMREADDEAMLRSRVYVDTRAGGLAEAGELVQAIERGVLKESDIVGDLFALAGDTCPRRESEQEITLFKSVGTALEDLAAAVLATGSPHA